MSSSREYNIEVFEDTKKLCLTNTVLKDAIKRSNEGQRILYESEPLKLSAEHCYQEPAAVIVSKKRSLEAAGAYKGMHICVHNFASATNPGGGVTRGLNAQEEAICRCSTLYFNISEDKTSRNFHNLHRQLIRSGNMDATYNADCIYTPDVVVFKTDTSSPQLMAEADWFKTDIITCAAPNLRERPSNAMNPNSGSTAVKVSDKELTDLHKKRAVRILELAKKEGAEVIVLGAFGCGAFSNPPEIVAGVMAEMVEKYQYDFKIIEFAVYCPPQDAKNYEVFQSVIPTRKN